MSQRHCMRAALAAASVLIAASGLLWVGVDGADAQDRGLTGWAPFGAQVRGGWEPPWRESPQSSAQPHERAPNHERVMRYRPLSNPFGRDNSGFEHDERDIQRRWSEAPEPGEPTLAPANVAALRTAVRRFADIVADGGWPRVPDVEMRRGGQGQAVAALRQRLETVGDLRPQGGRYSGSFDVALEEAVRTFQRRHGLAPTGAVDQATLEALNVAPSVRLRQLRTNLVRLQSLAKAAGDRYVAVNIPAAQVEAVENGRVVSRHMAVVGKIDRQTPLLRSRIHEVNFNPYWHVPASIVRKDLVPKARDYARRGLDVLEVYRMEVFDGSGRKLDPDRIDWFSEAVYSYRYRQMPWEENSMGFVRINFANKHAVFLHDTPSQSLFSRDWRAESSGCVRVQDVERLVTWLLEGTPGWDQRRVSEMKRNGERRDVSLAQKTPVYLVYVSSWATPDGTVHFRPDLYQRDGVGQTASAD